MSLSEEIWVVDDRGSFQCVRNGYKIVTAENREYVGDIRLEEDAEHIVTIHNECLKNKMGKNI